MGRMAVFRNNGSDNHTVHRMTNKKANIRGGNQMGIPSNRLRYKRYT